MKRKITSTKRKTTKRISPPKVVKEQDLEVQPFHIAFPFTLEYKDNTEFKRCYFSCEEHLKKYIERYKLKKNTYKVFDTIPRTNDSV